MPIRRGPVGRLRRGHRFNLGGERVPFANHCLPRRQIQIHRISDRAFLYGPSPLLPLDRIARPVRGLSLSSSSSSAAAALILLLKAGKLLPPTPKLRPGRHWILGGGVNEGAPKIDFGTTYFLCNR